MDKTLNDLFTVRIAVQGKDVYYNDIHTDSAKDALIEAFEAALKNPKLAEISGGLPWRV